MSRTAAHLILFLGLVLVSTSGPFLRAAQMDAYAVAFWRLALTGAIYGVWAVARGEWRVDRRHVFRVVLGGVLLASHFATWVKAFDLTDYASNLLLLVVQPVMAAVAGIWLGEHPTRATWISVALATLGLGIITKGDIQLGPMALIGDLISVLGSIAVTLFYAITRDARRELPLSSFMTLTMLAGAVTLAPIVWFSGARFVGYPSASWGWLAALVLITTVAGHGTMNFVSRYIRLFTLNVVIVLEPPIAILIGMPLFGASVTSTQALGGVVLAVAVVVGLLPQAVTAPSPQAATQS
jgi:drug/metabolite transporter (DMT)-like permease